MKQRILYLMIFCLTMGAFARGQESADSVGQQEIVIRDSANFVKASLMIAEPSRLHVQSEFGHAFLRMRCDEAGLDYCFSMESGDYEGFFDICTGHYPNRLINVPTAEYMKLFDREGRIVTEYPIDIRVEEGQRLWQLLDSVCLSGPSPHQDYFHHGCSQEVVRFVEWGLGGTIVYGENAKKFGNTAFILGNQLLPANSWLHIPPSMLATTDGTDRKLTDAEKAMIPSIIPTLLADARLVKPDGESRPVLKDTAPIVHQPENRTPESQALPIYVWFALLFLFTLVVNLVGMRGTGKWARCLSKVTDAGLFLLYNLILLAMVVVCWRSTLPTTSGWNWNYLIYNPIPLLVWFYDRFRGLSHGCWRKTYLAYACWLCLYMVVMFIVGDHLILEQYLLIGTFSARCLFKVKEHRIND
ncbi:MAG: hypothetical protein IJ762_11540 [Bacteroidaceae bacterium]|nr:hypothetical protein [Bacteroidaceae bacterium]MBR1789794.1 hypothetical protein [Bacteroidaceae bacterium]